MHLSSVNVSISLLYLICADWNFTASRTSSFSPLINILLLIYVKVGSSIFVLVHELKYIPSIIYFIAEIAPFLSTGSPFTLPSLSFRYILIIFNTFLHFGSNRHLRFSLYLPCLSPGARQFLKEPQFLSLEKVWVLNVPSAAKMSLLLVSLGRQS